MSNSDFKHVLVPTDFSDPAKHARDLGISIARKFNAELTLLHVYTIPMMGYEAAVAWPMEDLESSAEDALEVELQAARTRIPGCRGIARLGYPPAEIVKVAKETGADLIVMGTHGRHGLPRMLLGSVAEKIVRTSPVPVLTVAAEEAALASAAGDADRVPRHAS